MTTRLAAAITAAVLFGGMLYIALSPSTMLDAQTQRVVCPTFTPTPTPTIEAGVPTPTPTPPPAGSLPAFPLIFSGTATVAGNPIPDCTFIYAKVGEDVSGFVPIVNGEYTGVTIGARDATAHGQPITFHLSEDVVATETRPYVYLQGPPGRPQDFIFNDFVLTFPHLVTPSPTPEDILTTPVVVASPTPFVPVIPPTAPPTATPTPLTAQPAIYSGPLTIAGLAAIPPGSVLTARIGTDYESLPAAIVGQGYQSLVIAPPNSRFIGQPIEFFLNGFKSVSIDTFESGARKTNFEVVFIGFPTPTSEPTPTPEPTHTPVPTPTPVPPTSTPAPPATATATATPPPSPTATLIPTRTPIPTLPPPTPTPEPTAQPVQTRVVQTVVVTATPEPTDVPMPEPEPAGGFCSFAGPAPLSAGIGTLLMLFAPVGLLYGAGRVRNRKNRVP